MIYTYVAIVNKLALLDLCSKPACSDFIHLHIPVHNLIILSTGKIFCSHTSSVMPFLYLLSQESTKECYWDIFAAIHNQSCPFHIYEVKCQKQQKQEHFALHNTSRMFL